MAPIRIVIVGLNTNTSDTVGVGNWGVVAHLRPLMLSPHYELVGICNSSQESSAKSIAAHGLPSSVKPYGSIAEVAADPNVDFVSISVNVERHLAVAKPLAEAGKKVVVEWPLGKNVKEAEELVGLAKAKSFVGLQFRADPLMKKVKSLLAEGAIGDVTSTVAVGSSALLPGDVWFKGAEYYIDMKTGGHEYSIFFGHFLDGFLHALGDFDTLSAIVRNNHPTIPMMDVTTGEITDPAFPKTTPDHVLVQGTLASGALASLNFRKPQKPVDDIGLRWIITGTTGEIEITMPEDHIQQGNAGRKLRLRKGKEETEEVKWGVEEEEHVAEAKYPGQNTARLYDEIAKGGESIATFESSLRTHKLLERILDDAKFPY